MGRLNVASNKSFKRTSEIRMSSSLVKEISTIAHSIALYLIKRDTEQRGYPLNEEEVKEHVNKMRISQKSYTLINGDYIYYQLNTWKLKVHWGYKSSLKQKGVMNDDHAEKA